MEHGAINARFLKHCFFNAADGKRTARKVGMSENRMIWQAVERHIVKKSIVEKIGWKTVPCRLVVNLLIDHFQRMFCVEGK